MTPEEFAQQWESMPTERRIKYSRDREQQVIFFIGQCHQALSDLQVGGDLRHATILVDKVAEQELAMDEFVEIIAPADRPPFLVSLLEMVKALRLEIIRVRDQA